MARDHHHLHGRCLHVHLEVGESCGAWDRAVVVREAEVVKLGGLVVERNEMLGREQGRRVLTFEGI